MMLEEKVVYHFLHVISPILLSQVQYCFKVFTSRFLL